MLPAAWDPGIHTKDISILKQREVWKCVKMSTILLYYYVEGHRFSDETGFIFEEYLLVDRSKILMFDQALPKSFIQH